MSPGTLAPCHLRGVHWRAWVPSTYVRSSEALLGTFVRKAHDPAHGLHWDGGSFPTTSQPSSVQGWGCVPSPGKQLRDHGPAHDQCTTETPSSGPDTSLGSKCSFSGPNTPFLEPDPHFTPIFLLWPTAWSPAEETTAPSLAAMRHVTAGAPTYSPPCHHKLGMLGTMFSPWLSAIRSKFPLDVGQQ